MATQNMKKKKSTPLWARLLVPDDAPSYQRGEAIVGWLMAMPAIIILGLFLVVPFLMAFSTSFTNARLTSNPDNPTEFVGFRNFERLLTIRTFTIEPLIDEATGEILLDDEGQIAYPRLRTFVRNNPEYPELDGLREFTSFQTGNNRTYILAGDPVFLRALVNTIIFSVVIAPIQGGFALLLALLLNQALPGINIFRAIYFAPVVMSMVVVSLLWRFIYDGQNGLLNAILDFLTFGNFEPID